MRGPTLYFLLPGAADTPTGGFVYDRHMIRALRSEGRLADCLVLPGRYPEASHKASGAAARSVRELPDGAGVIVDGLAFAPLLELFAAEAERLRIYALIHHALCDESGLGPGQQVRLFERERNALKLARGVIVTSQHTAARLIDFGVAAERIRVVRPGVDAVKRRRTSPASRNRTLLCVASLTPRKGQDLLLHALARLRHFPWRLLLVGPVRDANSRAGCGDSRAALSSPIG